MGFVIGMAMDWTTISLIYKAGELFDEDFLQNQVNMFLQQHLCSFGCGFGGFPQCHLLFGCGLVLLLFGRGSVGKLTSQSLGFCR